MKFLVGYKTYIAAGAMLVYAIVIQGWQNGDWSGAMKTALQAFAVFGMRSAIAVNNVDINK